MSTDISIDIETLGQGPNAPVLSVGWCWFSWDDPTVQPHGMQYHILDVESQMKDGAEADYKTIAWWMGQGDEARLAAFPSEYSAQKPERFLDVIPNLMEEINRAKGIWAKGPDFDCVILNSLLKRTVPAIDYRWPFWNHRDVRTVMSVIPTAYPAIHKADAHNALNDAVHQANLMREASRALRDKWYATRVGNDTQGG